MDNNSDTCRITIGMPVYNGEDYLAETLDTVLAQTYSKFILYIADNASTDRTEEICREYARKDSRIVYARNPKNVGAAGNYERCFTPATTEYFRWQNADDPIGPTLIEDCFNALENDSSIVLAYCKSRIIDDKGTVISDYEDNLSLQQASASERFISCVNVIRLQNVMYGLIRREPLAHTALLGAYTSSDLNLVGELSLYGKFEEIPKRMFNRRVHPESSSWDMSDAEKLKEFWDPSKRKLIMQTWRSMYEYYKAVFRSPVSFGEKLKISKYLLKHAYWRKTAMIGELRDLIKGSLLKAS